MNAEKNHLNWPIFDSFTHILNMKGKIMCKEAWCGICNLFSKSNLDIEKIKKLFNLGNINPMDNLSGITTTNGHNHLTEDKDDFSRFFSIMSNEPSEFVQIVGNESIINTIIGKINNNKIMKEYLMAINKYFKGNPCCHSFTAMQIKEIMKNHDIYIKGKIDDSVFNAILDLCKTDEYINLFDINNLNIGKNLVQYENNNSGGSLENITLIRFLKESSKEIDIKTRNLLVKYTKREKDLDKNYNKTWLELINCLLKIKFDFYKEVGLNNINDILEFIKSFVRNCVKNVGDSTSKESNSIYELLQILKGKNFDIKTLLNILKEYKYK